MNQDPDVREPRIRLRLLLQLLRIAAAQRGHAAVVWSGAGFTYHLEVARGDAGAAVTVDHDPDADPTVIDRIREALYPTP
jgi:hypothetical protein